MPKRNWHNAKMRPKFMKRKENEVFTHYYMSFGNAPKAERRNSPRQNDLWHGTCIGETRELT